MASHYAIETVFRLVDQATTPANRVGKSLDNLGIKSKAVSNILKQDFDKVSRWVDKLGKSPGDVVKEAAFWKTIASGAVMGIATKQFIEFDDVLHRAGVVFPI
jgi:hypothetical protein